MPLLWIMHVWDADLHQPLLYDNDALFHAALIKGTIDHGWPLGNPSLGMPFGAHLNDFTGAEDFYILMFKLIALFTADWALVMNAFFLLSFPLTAIGSFYVFRKFHCSLIPSAVGSLLYTYLPYHFFRGEKHLLLSSYYIVPLVLMAVLWTMQKEVFFSSPGKAVGPAKNRIAAGIAICMLTAISGVYYAFFAAFFFLVAGVKVLLTKKNRPYWGLPFLFFFTICFTSLASLSPSLVYQYNHGRNPIFSRRPPQETESLGLKITQLLSPVDQHRVPWLASWKLDYNRTAPLINENRSATLGFLGSIGFLGLLLGLFFHPPGEQYKEVFRNLSLLNIAAVLWATVGGFGSLFAYTLFPQFRGINRISVFIAFFALFFLVLLLETLARRLPQKKGSTFLFSIAASLLTFFGIWDQTTPSFIPPYSYIQKEYSSDARFFAAVESLMPNQAMVFQLPQMLFPETPAVHKIYMYQHIRGYLHSKQLRWSYGTIWGREGAQWQKWVAMKPLPEFLEILRRVGFQGLYIDTYGYPDGGNKIIETLKVLLRTHPLESDNQRMAFFDLAHFSPSNQPSLPDAARTSLPGVRKLSSVPFVDRKSNVKYSIDTLKREGDYYEISGWAFIDGEGAENIQIDLALISEAASYVIPTSPHPRPDVESYFHPLPVRDAGFSSIICREELEAGSYRIGFKLKKNASEASCLTGQKIKIHNR